jgi:hypothetical protein
MPDGREAGAGVGEEDFEQPAKIARAATTKEVAQRFTSGSIPYDITIHHDIAVHGLTATSKIRRFEDPKLSFASAATRFAVWSSLGFLRFFDSSIRREPSARSARP